VKDKSWCGQEEQAGLSARTGSQQAFGPFSFFCLPLPAKGRWDPGAEPGDSLWPDATGICPLLSVPSLAEHQGARHTSVDFRASSSAGRSCSQCRTVDPERNFNPSRDTTVTGHAFCTMVKIKKNTPTSTVDPERRRPKNARVVRTHELPPSHHRSRFSRLG
jgi:hypothetical protein